MVLDRFNHHLVLVGRHLDLHPARLAHRRVRHIAIPADFVRGIDDNHPFGFGQDPGGFAQQGGFAHARTAQDQDAFPAFDDVLDDVNRPVDGAAHAQGQPHDLPAPVANGRDAMQGPFDARAVIGVKIADPFHDMIQFFAGDLFLAQDGLFFNIARRGNPPQIQDDLEQFIVIIGLVNSLDNRFWNDTQEDIQIIGNAALVTHKDRLPFILLRLYEIFPSPPRNRQLFFT